MPSASTSPKFPSAGEMMSQASGFSNNHTAIQHHDHQLHHEHEHVTERTPLRTRTAVHDHHHYGITIKERQSSEGEDSSVEEQESRALLDSSAHDDTAELSEEERGSLSDSSLQLQKRSKLAAAYRMKVRRTPMVARRRVLRFKRVKRHQAKGRQLATITDQDDELYDSRKESTMYRLSAFCTCEELNFDAIIHFFEVNTVAMQPLTMCSPPSFATLQHLVPSYPLLYARLMGSDSVCPMYICAFAVLRSLGTIMHSQRVS